MPKQRVLQFQRGNGRAPADHSKQSPHSHVHEKEQHSPIVRTGRRLRELEFLRPTSRSHAFPNVDNAPSNAICRKLGFELLEACEFEFPKGHFMICNDWRLDLRA
jgi:hypothetical protein